MAMAIELLNLEDLVFLEEDSFTLALVPEKAKEGSLKLKFQNFLKFFQDSWQINKVSS